jgi:RNA polymerase sigma-70 factor (ECF subfamily)
MTIAHRRAVDRVRHEQRTRARNLRLAAVDHSVDYDTVAEYVEQTQERDAVRACLGSLTALQRESIELAYYAGLSYAERLRIPLGTARTRIRAGSIRLRDCLGVTVDPG